MAFKFNIFTRKPDYYEKGAASMPTKVSQLTNDSNFVNAAGARTAAKNDSDIASAISTKHSHSNKTALDNVSGTNTGDEHTIESHSDTSATGEQLDTLTEGGNADNLHIHDYAATNHSHEEYAASDHTHDLSGDSVTVNALVIAGEDALSLTNTVWDDIRVPVTSTKLGGSKAPEFAVLFDNGAGSQGVFTYLFDKDAEEELYFTVQLPHNYKYGTDLHAHVHWSPTADGVENSKVNWGLEYILMEIGQVGSTTNIISNNVHSPADVIPVTGKHYLTEIGEISGANIDSVSAMILCRVFRDATGALKTDDYGRDAALLEIDFHYEIDSLGSREEYTK